MLIDGLKLFEGSSIANATVASGTAFPDLPSVAELFFRTDLDEMFVHNGTAWVPIQTGTGTAQPLNADLTSISNLAGTSGLLRKTAVSTYVLDTASYLTANQTITVTGDVSGSGSTSLTLSLPSVGVSGTYGSASSVPVLTTDTKGRVSGVTSTLIDIATSQVSSGTFANARIAQSSVTQHQAALSIAETQIPNGTLLARVADDEMVTGNWQFTNPVTSVTPTALSHLTTKSYVDSVIAGLAWKQPARVATTANITLSGIQTIDGNLLVAGDRVLVKDQTVASQNGVWVVTTGAWTRATDFDSTSPIDEVNSAAVFVSSGAVNANTGWTQVLHVTTVGTDAMGFIQFSASGAYQAGSGLSLNGTTFNVGTASTSRIIVGVDTIDLAMVGTPSTYKSVTTDAYGRVTAGTNPTTLAGFGITDAQSYSADLAAIAGLIGTGTLTRTGAGAWSLDTNTYLTSITSGQVITALGYTPYNGTTNPSAFLTSNQAITLSGDISGTGTTSISGTLATVNLNVGSFGSASSVPVLTVNAKGLTTAASSTLIAIDASQVSTGTFADARISQTSVTQYQGALSIAESQIPSGGLFARVNDAASIWGSWGFFTCPNAVDPSVDTHVANKRYVDRVAAGLSWKSPAKAATTANITLSGTQTIDGYAAQIGDRILVKNQTNGAENGVYVVASGAWTRPGDFDHTSPINEVNNAAVFVTGGTVNAGTGWTQTANITTIGVDAMVFVQFTGTATYIWGDGLTLAGNTVNVVSASSSRIAVGVDSIDLAIVANSGTGSFVKVSTDSYGRVTGTSPVLGGDVVGVLSPTTIGTTAVAISGTTSSLAGLTSLSAGTVTATTAVAIGTIGLVDAVSATTASTSQFALDTNAITAVRAVKYQVTVTTGSGVQYTEVSVLHDGTNVYVSESNTMQSGASLASFSADITAGNLRLLATPASASSTAFKAVAIAVTI